MPTGQTALAHAHVIKGRRIVARQRELITEIAARGGDCESAQDLLAAFERSLAIFEDDLAAIIKKEACLSRVGEQTGL
jgi:hypothetical protein